MSLSRMNKDYSLREIGNSAFAQIVMPISILQTRKEKLRGNEMSLTNEKLRN